MLNHLTISILSVATFGYYGISTLVDWMSKLQPIIDVLSK